MRAKEVFARHREVGLDLVRAYLGVSLLVRGILFIANRDVLVGWIESAGWLWSVTLAHLVVVTHVAGGLLLALGLFTRFAALIQLPPLLGAVFLVHWEAGLLQPGQSLELAGLILVLLVIFALFGSGPFSIDALVGRNRAEEPREQAPKSSFRSPEHPRSV